jgi:tight adherence protein B
MSTTLITILSLGLVVLLAGLFAIIGMVSAFVGTDDISDRIQTYALVRQTETQSSRARWRGGMTRFRLRLNALLTIFPTEELALQLMSAHWPITELEFLLIRIIGVILSFFVGWALFRSPLSGLGLAVIAYLIPNLYLSRSIRQRREKFHQQLVDVLVLLTGGIRAGYSLLQALEHVGKEMPSPSSEEFKRVRQEIGLGLPLNDALINLAKRMENKDLTLLVMAITINNQVGGNLTTMMEVVTDTIRTRIRLFNEVRVETAQQRYTGYVLTLLPFLVGAVLFLINPNYMSRILERDLLCIPIGALVGIILGNLVIRKIVDIDI